MNDTTDTSAKQVESTPEPWRIVVKPNARLIAAAPELFNACGLIEEWLEAKDDPSEQDKTALGIVRAALRLARLEDAHAE